MKRIITIVSFFTFLLTACKKEDSSVFVPDPGYKLDSAWVSSINEQSKICELVKTILPPPPVIDSAELFIKDTTFVRRPSFDIIIPPGTLKTSSATDITGKIYFHFYLAQKRGDYIRLQQSTINNESFLLNSGGSFYMRFFRGNEDLQLASGKNIIVRYNDSLPVQNMKVFYGADNIVNDVPVNTSTGWAFSSGNTKVKPVQRIFNTASSYGYEVVTDKLKWINTAMPLPQGLTLVNLSVYLPDLFTNANTQAYLVFSDARTIVKLSGDAGSRKFFAPNIPSGKAAKLVTISKIAQDYFLGTQDIITADKPVEIKPMKGGFDRIINYLNTL